MVDQDFTYDVAELQQHIVAASNFADWIYHDERLDCDNESAYRTSKRFYDIDSAYGRNVMFGIAGWWVISAYSRLMRAYVQRGITHEPDLTPKNIEEILNSDKEESIIRASVTARQFISAITHDDFEMAAALFDAAYNTSKEDLGKLMYRILLLCIRISNFAEDLRERQSGNR